MPELPEVETVRRRLAPVIEGAKITYAEIVDPRLTRPDDPLVVASELIGERFAELGRRGKYLLLRLASGRTLVVHLRMTGSFTYAARGKLSVDAYRRATLRLGNRVDLGFRDVRRFGTWLLLAPGEEGPYLAERLGPEPLSDAFSTAALAAALRGRQAPVKSVLLDQRRVAGVGNIYADEALWRARIAPRRAAGGLGPKEVSALRRTVRTVLEKGIALQGSTLRDYVTPDGEYGGMQNEFSVYGREGEPCPRCRTPIERDVIGGRGTWSCPACQPRLP
ncbi:MAG: bifunctional DNA-formamidopyrimidine glycosylase/DNA-(apurinic or apyrimidinic site) lyase [Gaiellales bacterium]